MRVLRPGRRLAFTTIEIAEDLSPRQRRLATVAAPRAAATRRPYVDVLATAGYDEIGSRDVSAEFEQTATAWLDHSEPVRRRLEEADGPEPVAEKIQGWREEIDAIAKGWVRRTLYWGRRPS